MREKERAHPNKIKRASKRQLDREQASKQVKKKKREREEREKKNRKESDAKGQTQNNAMAEQNPRKHGDRQRQYPQNAHLWSAAVDVLF